jgi:hypothetical protein
MSLKTITALLLLTSLFGCASIHSGNYAKQIDEKGAEVRISGNQTKIGLLISASENIRLSSLNFGLLEFTFENMTDEWLRIKTCKIGFGSEVIDSHVVITSGEDLTIWNKAVEQVAAIDDFNTAVVLGAIGAAGTVVSQTSRDNTVQATSGTIGLAALTSLSVIELNKMRDKIQTGDIFPASHLYAKGFNIPPGLFVKRWILVNSKNHSKIGHIKNITLEYDTYNDKNEKITIQFRGDKTSRLSKWQKDLL